jgi:hypothetical protein
MADRRRRFAGQVFFALIVTGMAGAAPLVASFDDWAIMPFVTGAGVAATPIVSADEVTVTIPSCQSRLILGDPRLNGVPLTEVEDLAYRYTVANAGASASYLYLWLYLDTNADGNNDTRVDFVPGGNPTGLRQHDPLVDASWTGGALPVGSTWATLLAIYPGATIAATTFATPGFPSLQFNLGDTGCTWNGWSGTFERPALAVAGELLVVAVEPLVTSESGGEATFTVALSRAPFADVHVAVASSDPGEATVTPLALTFSAADWDVPQQVTVTGVDDPLVDGTVGFELELTPTSDDAGFSGAVAVAAENLDDVVAALVLSTGGPLATSEDGTTDAFTVALASQPTAVVEVALASTAPHEATVAPSLLTFLPGTWDTPQQVEVTGEPDPLLDGPQPFAVTFSVASADADYDGLVVPPLPGINADTTIAPIPVNGPLALLALSAALAALALLRLRSS